MKHLLSLDFLRGPYFKGLGLKLTVFCALAFSGSVILDQVSKIHMHNTMLEWESEEDTDRYFGKRESVLTLGNKDGGFVSLGWQYSRNKGAAFSMFSNIQDRYRVPMFYAITFMAILLIYFYLRSTPADHIFTRYGLTMVLSGAIGNFLDRLYRGYVVDFIDVDWNLFGWRHDFAIFNIADVAINIGVVCLLLDIVVQSRAKKKRDAAAASSASQS